MRINLLVGLIFLTLSFSFAPAESNTTQVNENQLKINTLLLQKDALEKELLDNNIWSKIYSNYHTYKELKADQLVLEGRILFLEKKETLFENQRITLAKNKKD